MDLDRVAVFQDFNIARGQRAKAAFGADGVPAVHVLGGTGAADQRGQHHGHVLLVVARVASGDVDAAGVAPGAHGTVGCGLLQGHAHGIGQCLHGRGGAVDVGGRLPRIAQRAHGPQVDADAAVQTLVIGWRHLGKHHQAQVHTRVGIAGIGVDEVRHLRRTGDGDVAAVGLDGDGGADLEFPQTVTGIFQHGGGLVDTIGHRGN